MASRTRRYFLNALTLTLTALVMRGVGVAFNVYVSNRVGSEAMGLYSLLGGVYGFSVTLGAAGINLGTTRLVTDAIGLHDYATARRAVKRSLLICTVTGGAATVLLFTLAPVLGTGLLGDARATLPLRILSLTLLPVAICSCLSGYFTAVRRVKINSAMQIPIQLLKIAVTGLLLARATAYGTEGACVALVLGTAVTEFLSLAITYALYRFDLRKLKADGNPIYETTQRLTSEILKITLPVTFSACIRSALTMLQHTLIPKGLCAGGIGWEQALSAYGALHGMAMPIVLFPSAFISAFAGLLIPEISECCVLKDEARLERVSRRALSLSLFYSIGVAGIMIFFSNELGLLIYNSAETAKYIRVMAPLIPVMYIDSAVDAVLKGSGHQVYSMNVNIADALSSCVLVFLLTPRLGIWGYVISIYATELLNTTLSLFKMISVSKMKPRIVHQVLLPVICVIIATRGAGFLLRQIGISTITVPSLILNILLTAALYLLMLLLTRTIGRDEGEVFQAAMGIRSRGSHAINRLRDRA